MVCLTRVYHSKCFKGCLPEILFGLFLNTLSQVVCRQFNFYHPTILCLPYFVTLLSPLWNTKILPSLLITLALLCNALEQLHFVITLAPLCDKNENMMFIFVDQFAN